MTKQDDASEHAASTKAALEAVLKGKKAEDRQETLLFDIAWSLRQLTAEMRDVNTNLIVYARD